MRSHRLKEKNNKFAGIDMKRKVLGLGVALLLSAVGAKADGFVSSVGAEGFLQSGDVKWKRLNISKRSNESEFAFFQLQLECNPASGQVYLGEVGLALISKAASTDSDVPNLFVNPKIAFTKPYDWKQYEGKAKLYVMDGANKPVELEPLVYSGKFNNGKALVDKATFVRLNPEPSEPATVSAYSGASKALANEMIGKFFSQYSIDLEKKPVMTIQMLSAVGTSNVFGFDLANIRKETAVLLNKTCGTK